MLEKDIRTQPPNLLTREQQQRYFEDGFLVLPEFLPAPELASLRAALAELLDRSRALSVSNAAYILEEGHAPDNPRLHRIVNPQDEHPAIWDFLAGDLMTGLAADVVGPNVKFHHCKLNVKAGNGSGNFEWHQDIPGWPHTDFSPVTMGVFLEACEHEQGPLTVVRGSNHGALYRMHNDEGKFVGIDPAVLAQLDKNAYVEAIGGAGTVLLLNCRAIHGSGVNRSAQSRPLLLPVYSSADSFCYVRNPLPTPREGEILRGEPARFACFDTRPCPMPPDWARKKSNPWMAQKAQREAANKAAA